MPAPNRSAAGAAAGFHFQIQQSLVLLLAGLPGSEVSLETVDDVVLRGSGDGPQHHQLKHSIRAGTLTDSSEPLWKALDGWMDTEAVPGNEDVTFRLIATHAADDGSAVAALRREVKYRDVAKAEKALVAIAQKATDPPARDASDLQRARARFSRLPPARRRQLLERVYVHDGDGDIGELRDRLRKGLGDAALPQTGVELFLDQIMGWWENLAAGMLMSKRASVSRDETIEHIRGVRDSFGPGALPALDPDLLAGLTDAVATAYRKAPFVRQLELLTLLDDRVQLAIEDYHRAYVQRSRWVKHAILTGGELDIWEDALIDEWKHAFLRMCDEIPGGSAADGRTDAGKRFFGAHSETATTPLRAGGVQHPVIRRGTLHGLSDLQRIGWHPDFQTLLGNVLDGAVHAPSSKTFDAAVGESL